ncbi:hypothetical protein CRM22_009951 [Opisthorchis felineus]|uniref:DNA helicase MCM9 n=1 Tax=Opisthorchis felineus TaxID=147828 RepID=A0A4S2L9Z3_OPIFE|nr:hypothetical protein CRM22_009951 [Opisthorchis felineus]
MPRTLNNQKSKEYVSALFREYLLRDHRSDLMQLSTQSNALHRSIVVHFNYLCEFDNIFSELLLVKPENTLMLLNEGLRASLTSQENTNERVSADFESFVHVRLTALPVIPEVHKTTIPLSSDVGRFIALRCTVSRVGPIQVLQGRATYVCSKCGYRFPVDACFENQYMIKPPRYCPNRDPPCGAPYLKPVANNVFCAKNYQEIRVHERFRCLSVGVMPRSIRVCLEDDLVETVKPGDDVVVNGIVTRRWQTPRENSPCDVSLWIRANYVENLSELKTCSNPSRLPTERIIEFQSFWARTTNFTEALEARNTLLRSICPDVCGMYLVKLSLALMLASSPDWNCSSGDEKPSAAELKPRIRGSPHILLVGDPGTAKSILLRSATSLSSRAVLTAATVTTAAGLTAAAVRDAHGWSLDAGALVLADGGLCAIDEFTALQGTHRSAVHEAMEQQTISLAKAGLITRLNCRCSVLAAANPPLEHSSRSDDFGLPTSLLSRFDLIWRLVDPMDSVAWDRKIADFILKLDSEADSHVNSKHHLWPTERLREYFTWVRQEFKPRLSPSAANLLQRYYVWRRKNMGFYGVNCQAGTQGRTTLRLLESLVRLTRAHARLMARSEAGFEDAVIVIALMDASLESTTTGDDGRALTDASYWMSTPEAIVASDIPTDCRKEFRDWEQAVRAALSEISTDGDVPAVSEDEVECEEVDEQVKDSLEAFSLSDKDMKENSVFSLTAAPLFSSTQLAPFHLSVPGFEELEFDVFEQQESVALDSRPVVNRVVSSRSPVVNTASTAHSSPEFQFPSPRKSETKSERQQRICQKLSRFSANIGPSKRHLAEEHFPLRDILHSPQKPRDISSGSAPDTKKPAYECTLSSDVRLTDSDFEIDL